MSNQPPYQPPPVRKLVVWIGGSSGVGYAALESLLATGGSFNIVLGSRSQLEPWRYGQLQPSLKSSNSYLDVMDCDLTRYGSVWTFAEAIKTKYAEPIDALVLCAGKISARYHRTSDGQEETLQVNVLSHALLMDLLAPKLGVNGTPCRILMVTSSLHRSVPERTISPENIDEVLSNQFDPMQVYHITKLLQIFLMHMAQERFDADKRLVTVVAVSPGYIPDTGLTRELGRLKSGLSYYLMSHAPFATPIPDGGRTICRGITQNFPGGTYFSQRKVENTAEETYNMELRQAWKGWFIWKNVWKPEAPPPPMAPGMSAIPSLGHADSNGQPGIAPGPAPQIPGQQQGPPQMPMAPGHQGSYS
ncbi:hypothetical protein FRB95_011371 [Tulasnella sp. JGI-2019a]|nr:hypothetical protein FRB95_011371 [Tulasnella sp. JGI-2019a]